MFGSKFNAWALHYLDLHYFNHQQQVSTRFWLLNLKLFFKSSWVWFELLIMMSIWFQFDLWVVDFTTLNWFMLLHHHGYFLLLLFNKVIESKQTISFRQLCDFANSQGVVLVAKFDIIRWLDMIWSKVWHRW